MSRGGPRPHAGHRRRRRRGSGRPQHPRGGPVLTHRTRTVAPGESIEQLVYEIIEATIVKLQAARALYPRDDYSARLYHCRSCDSVHACVAPRVDLIDGYPCPHCKRPEVPWADAAP